MELFETLNKVAITYRGHHNILSAKMQTPYDNRKMNTEYLLSMWNITCTMYKILWCIKGFVYIGTTLSKDTYTARHNGFPPTIIQKLRHKIKHKTKHTTPHTNMNKNKKWATFTYISPHIRKITNLFRNTNVKIVCRCQNTIGNQIKPPKDNDTSPHNKRGIYQLTCNTWKLAYVGQTSCSLKIHFQEHIRYIRSNNPQLAFALHILQNQHEYGHMNNILTLLKPLNSSNMLIPYEQYYIQALYQEGKLIPEQYPGETNPLFQMVINPQPPHTT